MDNGFKIPCSIDGDYCTEEGSPRLMKSDPTKATLEAICPDCAEDIKDRKLVPYAEVRHDIRMKSLPSARFPCALCVEKKKDTKEHSIDELGAPIVGDLDTVLCEKPLTVKEAKKHFFCSECAESVEWPSKGSARGLLTAVYIKELKRDGGRTREEEDRQQRKPKFRIPREGEVQCLSCEWCPRIEEAKTLQIREAKDHAQDGIVDKQTLIDFAYCKRCAHRECNRRWNATPREPKLVLLKDELDRLEEIGCRPPRQARKPRERRDTKTGALIKHDPVIVYSSISTGPGVSAGGKRKRTTRGKGNGKGAAARAKREEEKAQKKDGKKDAKKKGKKKGKNAA